MTEQWVWLDLELTGLELDTDTIIEIAVILTDSNLNLIAEGPDIVIKADASTLEQMVPFVKEMHAKSGLAEEVLRSTVTLAEATETVLSFLNAHNVKKGIIAGNSVHQDRLFLLKHMPTLFEGVLHPYRVIDVTALKELFLGWRPKDESFKKPETHRSKEDILSSLKELQFYLFRLALTGEQMHL
mmetsp:Transcript_13230/g.24789  ORF Transcript_13230/g.24789 Transcript_13230/m.24789 type:complete len:185 (+) Transcript_13230:1380-1934(+)